MSSDAAAVTRGLTKRYPDGTLAVDGVDLTVRSGEVYGLLGLNGAGKTTLLRALVGLVRPTGGEAQVLGLPAGHPDGLRRTGALIESPAFYPHMSGRTNLRVLARFAGLGDEDVERALATVGLAERAESRFGTYSLGMKQRLGVAAALLKEPDLLILDEPTNGLDAAGMAEMRALVLAIAEGHRTVILSSHLLGEVEQVCDRVGVIHRGRLVAEGTVAELRARMGSGLVMVQAKPAERAASVARGVEGVTGVEADGDRLLVQLDPQRAHELNAALVQAGVDVHELRPTEQSLEEIFMGLTHDAEDASRAEAAAEARA